MIFRRGRPVEALVLLSVDVVIREPLSLAHNDVDVDANQPLKPILLDIIQPMVMGQSTRPAISRRACRRKAALSP